jgi:alkylation response protein AidB-like acyl-CoA dehydrogenase
MSRDATARAEIASSVQAIIDAPDDETFRCGVREWLSRELRALAGERFGRAAMHEIGFRRQWEDHVCGAGWSGLGWPKQYGGKDLPLPRQAIFQEEYARVQAPLPVNMIGHGILGPTLLLHGSEEQKRRFLPPLLANRQIWCQGYSEPGAGSDLASLKTTAVPDGNGYRLNGQKIWTSFANIADWCFVLARTGAELPRHRGISFLLVDMRSPGVMVRPIRQITGEADYNEVFFDNVRVPGENLVGGLNGGWAIAMAASSFERGSYFAPRIVRMQVEIEEFVRLAARTQTHNGCAIDDAQVRDRLSRLLVDLHALRLNAQQMLSAAMKGAPAGAEGSAVKLLWSESHQRLFDLAMDVLGPLAQLGPQEMSAPREGRWQRDFLWTRAETILAGTSEIMRNIISERALGLPR